MKWSENQTYHFVKEYMRHENLWNTKHEHHKLVNLRIKSYKEIISQFQDITGMAISIPELKIKIKNLRSTYAQELAKIRRRSGPDRTYRSNLKWFSVWHKRYANNSSIQDQNNDYNFQQDHTADLSETCVSQTDDTSESSPVDPFVDDEDYTIIFKTDPDESQEHTNRSKIRKKKFRQQNHSTESSDKSSKDSSMTKKEDEFDIYGKYIAAQLRDMDLQMALRIQLKIQSIVSEARITKLVEEE